MNVISQLRSLVKGRTAGTSPIGTVVEVRSGGSILVRIQTRTVSCTTLIPVSAGDEVRVQGTLIVSRQVASTQALPEYRV